MSRIQAISHYLDRCFDNAAIIAALSTARSDQPTKLSRFVERQEQELVDRLHDFAFYGRKLVELVEREGWDSSKYARQESIACHRENRDGDMSDASMTLWDVFNRLIHSDRVVIDRSQLPAPDGNETIDDAAWAFSVASDKDKNGASTFVFLEFFLGDFLRFEEHLRRDLHRNIRLAK